MKKGLLINPELSRLIASLGHFDNITICDAGLPIPSTVQRIDLAVCKGVAGLTQVLDAVLSEMQVQAAEMAEEIKEVSPEMHREIIGLLESQDNEIPVSYVPHEEYKAKSAKCLAIVRSGEYTPYANITLQAGVVF